MAQPKSRVPLLLGLTLAGGAGYYIYQAGGNPKAAEKQFEADLSKASAKAKSEIPGRGKQIEKTAEAQAAEAGAKADSVAEKARSVLQRDAEVISAYRKDKSAAAMAKIEKFDAAVEKEAAKAKSGILSWFGGK